MYQFWVSHIIGHKWEVDIVFENYPDQTSWWLRERQTSRGAIIAKYNNCTTVIIVSHVSKCVRSAIVEECVWLPRDNVRDRSRFGLLLAHPRLRHLLFYGFFFSSSSFAIPVRFMTEGKWRAHRPVATWALERSRNSESSRARFCNRQEHRAPIHLSRLCLNSISPQRVFLELFLST